jgi:hypothetical protein
LPIILNILADDLRHVDVYSDLRAPALLQSLAKLPRAQSRTGCRTASVVGTGSVLAPRQARAVLGWRLKVLHVLPRMPPRFDSWVCSGGVETGVAGCSSWVPPLLLSPSALQHGESRPHCLGNANSVAIFLHCCLRCRPFPALRRTHHPRTPRRSPPSISICAASD